MDFPNAKLPELKPLANSAGQSNFVIEDELRNLFIQLFADLMAETVFDANVLGMAHLGSLNLVRKSINYDGLVLLAGDREETATRYIYRAWKSRNCQGRGFHFLQTYLQQLFPNASLVQQMAQPKAYPYPTKLVPMDSVVANNDYHPTSRISVSLDYQKVSDAQLSAMKPVLRSVVPARITLDFSLLTTSNADDYLAAAFFISSTLTLVPAGDDESIPDADLITAASFFSIQTLTISPSL